MMKAVLLSALLLHSVNAQTFQRLGACPTLGCVFPPDQTDFLVGQLFDIRLEVHAPANGPEAFAGGSPDLDFRFCIQKGSGACKNVTSLFPKVKEPSLERWSFNYFVDLFASEAGTTTTVNVAAKAYRALAFTSPGRYTARLKYYNTTKTVAHWDVRTPARRRAKNVIFFIGDGMSQPMITAARLIAHKSINGKYQSLMQLDQMDALGHQMTHSIDSFITDSANSATALYTGKKSTVNALNVWVDSSRGDPFDDPKVETIAELFKRKRGGAIGIVSTATLADATPAALCAHTRDRGQAAPITTQFLFGNSTLGWPTGCFGPDVLFGGGAENYIAGPSSPNGTDMYKTFQDAGYNVVYNNQQLKATSNNKKTLGVFSISNMAKWLDRNVYPENLRNQKNSPTGDGTDALDQPGLKEMTLKAIDVLRQRQKGKNTGWFLMSEAASIDKMMHAMDYDRALGELLELDDTVRATLAHLKKIGEDKDTLVVISADHAHSFDVFGGVDTEYLAAQTTDRKKRAAVGVYERSGLSGYTVAKGSSPNNNTITVGSQGPNFPVTWDPRFTYAAGFGAAPDHREGFVVNETGPRVPTTPSAPGVADFVVNPKDQVNGFTVGGSIPVDNAQGVHSLQDVPVYASGPGSEAFRGVYNNVDIFFKIADALGLGGA